MKLETHAAMIDGIITASAGLGLLAIPLLTGTVLGALVPIGDSIVLLFLCLLIIANPVLRFRQGLTALAGAPAAPEHVRIATQTARNIVAEKEMRLVDVTLTRIGRVSTLIVYADPQRNIGAADVDLLREAIQNAMRETLKHTRVYVLISEHGRGDFTAV